MTPLTLLTQQGELPKTLREIAATILLTLAGYAVAALVVAIGYFIIMRGGQRRP